MWVVRKGSFVRVSAIAAHIFLPMVLQGGLSTILHCTKGLLSEPS
jgi:hypothetical protein